MFYYLAQTKKRVYTEQMRQVGFIFTIGDVTRVTQASPVKVYCAYDHYCMAVRYPTDSLHYRSCYNTFRIAAFSTSAPLIYPNPLPSKFLL